ncbi:bifunctional [glutamine synthetase] adenylyltransferase/[glutamine synthetase]-adenylyl-L-tyrosine phosphorylase [Allorhizobium sp. BGMRC 0089]|uniref:bifunctional [glutamine synthetase] adenylyltransferase/[glutamine synthetase]-adenylyl-L-tyrosine phosphorylase n=1 Tax=Allorhizobium sonneratiae TaxID=2934936 RepID=UPI0020341906|nr:bifunctional [glutamine synthetase] adenylyltransferase/[glutamine synthetase]-adenylyl-L-tyrosine phosphorylase [Allorhizobium sonneratiae]MCM2291922.1 bifunctional [glutamine synthetase] adenylyltransferase/[glutamine synthetase]-adenylyl-L-tyrosine phosphorylase [Allorhizobium sonneratiae]
MMERGDICLSALENNPLQPLNKASEKAVLALLKAKAKDDASLADCLASDLPVKQFVVAALSLSPYLRDTVERDADVLVRALTRPLQSQLDVLVTSARNAWQAPEGQDITPSEAEVMRHLRRAKGELAFLVALADLARIFDARQSTLWLSRMAEAAVSAAIDHLLLSGHQAGQLRVKSVSDPSAASGLIVLGMGKLGAGELNYSSDIDLVVFFDPDSGILAEPERATELYGRMMRRLVRILQERTGDGYVFRTDLRLRPDPGATPLAVPVEAALIYYEGRGQNWERAAFIKARPVAGDLAAGLAFLKDLSPFVFRKYLDYAAIADIHSIKRQIHSHKGHGAIAVKGHNVKLGRGGIREIEFFVQTQQLIAGGRMPQLRVRSTEEALVALEEARWIGTATRRALTEAYWFLRDVEHRIQMVHDEQSHELPTSAGELKRIALLCGFETVTVFSNRLERILRLVESCYARLFEEEDALSSGGNLVFTGQNDDPGTLETLKRLGFERPGDMAKIIRTWHSGRYRATQSVEARERLTELTPRLLQRFGMSRRADEALLRFDAFLRGLPAGIQLFSLIGSNLPLLDLLVTVMAAAPRLADIIASRPHVFDGMLDPALMVEVPTRSYLTGRLKSFLTGSLHYEDLLDRLRIFAAEQRFLIGIRLLTGSIDGAVAGSAFTDLADLLLAEVLAAVQAEMERAHGRIAGGRVALLGMGKLGSRELTAGSDVDLILLYEHDDDAEESTGEKPLDPVRYYTRFTQRLIAALSAPMAEGVLYAVDMRLRPSGNKGPVATRLHAFARYQKEEAWTWEHMALSRARLIAGDTQLMQEAARVVADVLLLPRDTAKIAADVAEMRALIEQEKPPHSLFDLKLVPGGMIDLEFMAQFLVLTSGASDGFSGRPTVEILAALAGKAVTDDERQLLLTTLRLYTDLTQLIRVCLNDDRLAETAPAGLIDRLTRLADCPDLKTLEAELKRRGKAVRRLFYRILQV